MSSGPDPRALSKTPVDGAIPFDAYAEVVRTLVPGVRKICFHDRSVRARWISDGIEEPEVRTHTHRALTQVSDVTAAHASSTGAVICVMPIRGPHASLRGAMSLIVEPALSTEHVRSALTPILRIIGHAWSQDEALPAMTSPRFKPPVQTTRAPLVGPAARATAAPVLLRRALGKAVTVSDCSVAALLSLGTSLCFVQRVTDTRSPRELQQSVERLRNTFCGLMHGHRVPVVIASAELSTSEFAGHKCLACPILTGDDRTAAVLMLFRGAAQRDFDAADSAALMEIAARLPAHVLEELSPPNAAAAALDMPSDRPAASAAAAVPSPPARRSLRNVLRGRTNRRGPRARPLSDSSSADSHTIRDHSTASLPQTTAQPAAPGQRIRAALRADEFELHAQRIVRIAGASELDRHEIYVRLRDQGALQPPAAFFDAAASAGLMHELDQWVIRSTVKLLRQRAVGSGSEFAVNMSSASLLHPGCGEFIEAQLFRARIDARTLVFEFSECDVLEHRPAFEQLAPRLNELGCRIALDNCRQGLDIFMSIARLPVHRLKIDAALTHHLATDPRAAQAVRELVEVASDIGIETVGEQVEDEATYQKLAELGVEFAQGFHVSGLRALADVLTSDESRPDRV